MGEVLPLTRRSDYDFFRSTNQRRIYRTCGYKWFLQYRVGWHSRTSKGGYQFGLVMEALATLIATRQVTDPEVAATLFSYAWAQVDQKRWEWSKNRSYEMFKARGPALAALLVSEIPAWVMPQVPYYVQEDIRFLLAPGVGEIARPDLYTLCRVPGANGELMPQEPVPTVLDFKTYDKAYPPLSAELDEQLTDYQLAEEVGKQRPVEQVGLCVMIYQEKPKVQWLFSPRRSMDVMNRFLQTATAIDQQIKNGIFYQNDRACFSMGSCDFVPICYASASHERDQKLYRSQPDEMEFTGWDEEEA